MGCCYSKQKQDELIIDYTYPSPHVNYYDGDEDDPFVVPPYVEYDNEIISRDGQ